MYRLYIIWGYMRQHIITKRIAKHGSQSIIVIPRVIEQDLKPGTLVKLTIDVLEGYDGK